MVLMGTLFDGCLRFWIDAKIFQLYWMTANTSQVYGRASIHNELTPCVGVVSYLIASPNELHTYLWNQVASQRNLPVLPNAETSCEGKRLLFVRLTKAQGSREFLFFRIPSTSS